MTALEPLFTLRQATDLIPMASVQALTQWLSRHRDEFPARYVLVGRAKKPRRLLLQSEILAIRSVKLIHRGRRSNT